MDRSGSGVVSGGSGVVVVGSLGSHAVNSGDSFSPQKEAVTLLSYSNGGGGGRFYQQQGGKTKSSLHQRPPVKKSAEKFFRTLRKRSKSASRLNCEEEARSVHERGLNQSETDVEEDAADGDGDDDVVITYRVNERPPNPGGGGKREKVQLVGFAHHSPDDDSRRPFPPTNLSKSLSPSAGDLLLLECASGGGNGLRGGNRLRGGGARRHLDFGGSVSNLCLLHDSTSSSKPTNFATLKKTSREVKMERERLRMEKMLAKERARLQQERQALHADVSGSPSPRLQLLPSAAANEDPLVMLDRLHGVGGHASNSSSDNDVFGQFVRENQERFAQLVQQHRSAASTLSERVRLQQQQQQLCGAFAGSGGGGGSGVIPLRTSRALSPTTQLLSRQQQESGGDGGAASATASYRSSARSATESSSSSSPKVHHIQIQRESLDCELSEGGKVDVRTQSNAKLQIIVNESANVVAATAAATSTNGVSNKKDFAGSESHSDVGSSCSDNCSGSEGRGDEEEEDETKIESDSSTLSSCNSSAQLSPKCKKSDRPAAATSAAVKDAEKKNKNNNGDKAGGGGDGGSEKSRNGDTRRSAPVAVAEAETEHLAPAAGDATATKQDEKIIEIKTESSAPAAERSAGGGAAKKCLDGESLAVHRSSSSSSRLSSSSSSGFSSIGPPLPLPLHTDRAAAALQKLQQLQQRETTRAAAFHHPTFANHFGFGRPGTGLRANTKTSMELIEDFASNGVMARQQQLFPSVGSFPNLMMSQAATVEAVNAAAVAAASGDAKSESSKASSASGPTTSASAASRKSCKSHSTTSINLNGKMKLKSHTIDYAGSATTNGKGRAAGAYSR